MKKISKNTKETEDIAKIFLAEIFKKAGKTKGSLVVALSGDLGAGKTAFTQAAAKHLGVKDKIKSPTFVIFKKYTLPSPSLRREGKIPFKFFFHLDAYRLKNEKELLHLGWEEIVGNKEHIVFIEWPENVKKIIPKDARHINISHKEKGQRILELK
jgi:tRNA threonylcarbamoyladenosine biosynthesis protein TsaE